MKNFSTSIQRKKRGKRTEYIARLTYYDKTGKRKGVSKVQPGRGSVWLQPSQPCNEKARPLTSTRSAGPRVFLRHSSTIPSIQISRNRFVHSVKAFHSYQLPPGRTQAKATQLKMRRSAASKNASERLKSKSDHLKKRTNCSTASSATIVTLEREMLETPDLIDIFR